MFSLGAMAGPPAPEEGHGAAANDQLLNIPLVNLGIPRNDDSEMAGIPSLQVSIVPY